MRRSSKLRLVSSSLSAEAPSNHQGTTRRSYLAAMVKGCVALSGIVALSNLGGCGSDSAPTSSNTDNSEPDNSNGGKADSLSGAHAANKYPENVPGKYYVDNQCIDCDLCFESAPANFKRIEEGGYFYVYKQPENADETARCRAALSGCPVDAIGDDGE